MINYTERISALVRDFVARVPRLSYIDPAELIVFARVGRSGAEGAFATCHCINLPPTEPGYYFWRDRRTGSITRRTPWFVTRSPLVVVDGRRIKYLVSFALPRFCDQTLRGSRKEQYYDRVPGWLAKLDTIVHELYHIDPDEAGIRRVQLNDGRVASGSHGDRFLQTVAEMVHEYLAASPDPELYDFLRFDFGDLGRHYGGVEATTFRGFPSFPQRYIEELPMAEQPPIPAGAAVQALEVRQVQRHFTECDLVTRPFVLSRGRPRPRPTAR